MSTKKKPAKKKAKLSVETVTIGGWVARDWQIRREWDGFLRMFEGARPPWGISATLHIPKPRSK